MEEGEEADLRSESNWQVWERRDEEEGEAEEDDEGEEGHEEEYEEGDEDYSSNSYGGENERGRPVTLNALDRKVEESYDDYDLLADGFPKAI